MHPVSRWPQLVHVFVLGFCVISTQSLAAPRIKARIKEKLLNFKCVACNKGSAAQGLLVDKAKVLAEAIAVGAKNGISAKKIKQTFDKILSSDNLTSMLRS